MAGCAYLLKSLHQSFLRSISAGEAGGFFPSCTIKTSSFFISNRIFSTIRAKRNQKRTFGSFFYV